MLFMYSPFRCG